MKTLLLLIAAAAIVLIILSRIGAVGKKVALYIILLMIALIMLLPFYMMFVMSTLKTNEIYSFPPILTFGTNLAENFKNMTASVNLPRAFLNSCIVTFSYVILVLFFCSIGGYAFSVYDFPGKNVLFAILLGTMMIPATAGMIPWFIMMSKFGWINDYKALIIPGCANAFGIFWMRQYCQNNVPKALMEAARIDGCSEWTIFFHVIAPKTTCL
jgi:ABC-type glycerol-3-phosphate transport system permease component